jgi:predicted NAD-dependent protein-ADP-ribosyltransferase YbiA (DUF1768 family)
MTSAIQSQCHHRQFSSRFHQALKFDTNPKIQTKKRGLDMLATVNHQLGQNSFLSNFWRSRVTLRAELVPGLTQDLVMNSVEAAYQAARCANPSDCWRFVGLNPFDAQRLGRIIKVRADWDSAKEKIMLELVKEKFLNPKLARQLVATEDVPIIVANGCSDPDWNTGTRFGCSENRLGRILMNVREHLIQVLSDF